MKKNLTLIDLQKILEDIYTIPDDQLYTIEDILYYNQKYVLGFLHDLSAKKTREAVSDLTVSLGWFMALISRYHLDLPEIIWKRYAYKCPFCLEIPCQCKDFETRKAKKTGRPSSRQPESIIEWQKMVEKIYPKSNVEVLKYLLPRVMDELNHSVRIFLRKREKKYFKNIEINAPDYFIILLRVYNYFGIDLDKYFLQMFKRGCYVCHRTPCICNYY